MHQLGPPCLHLLGTQKCIQMIIMGKSAEEAYEPFSHVDFRPFRDAGYGQCTYKCTVNLYPTQIIDCLRGLQYAMKLGWFDFKKFDIAEYEHF